MEFYENEEKDVLTQETGKSMPAMPLPHISSKRGKAISTLLNDMLSPSISQGISFPPARR